MIAVFILLVVLQIGDTLTTRHILNKGGRELNSVMAWAFSKIGMMPALIIKSIFVTALGWLAYKESPIALVFVAVLYVFVVSWNSYQIFISKK
jgi:hypothetical protein